MPVISADAARLGAVVVGGRNFGAQDERALKLLAASIAPALRSASEAPGGRDPVSGLPNRASLRRVLRRELASRVPLTVMAVGLEGLESRDRAYGPAAGDALLGELGRKLKRVPRGRVFHAARHELVVLLRGHDEREARGYARGLLRVIAQSTSGSAASPAASVGFVAIGPGGGDDPDPVLNMAAYALREAENRPERILRLPAGTRIGATKGTRIDARTTQAVRALMEAIAACDPHLAEHSRAVSELARRIALRMGLPREQVGAVAVGALLHDVGKITLPDAILREPRP